MNNVTSASLVRMALAFAAVLLIGGSGLVLAGSPGPTYVPTSSVLLGPTTVSKSGAPVQYRLQVTFAGIGTPTLTFPTPDTAAPGILAFTAVRGTFPGAPGLYTPPAGSTSTKERITATYTQNGVNVVSSLTVNLTP